MKSNYAFTLIELLIVIAIIGVLTAVLIPQLLNARVSANKRAIQAHSATLYKVAHAIQSEDSTLNSSIIAAQIEGRCNTDTSNLLISGTTFVYGWVRPAALNNCSVSIIGNDYLVIAQGNASADSKTSTNGKEPL